MTDQKEYLEDMCKMARIGNCSMNPMEKTILVAASFICAAIDRNTAEIEANTQAVYDAIPDPPSVP